MSTLAAPPSVFGAWILATRPRTLFVGATPVLVGAALAHRSGTFRPLPALAALVGALLLQIGSNLANDVFDYEKGADTAERLGPLRVTQAGLLSPSAMKYGMAVVFSLALLIGVYLTTIAGWPIVIIGLLSIASAIAYTGGPYPLGYNGLGDVFVFLFFGLVAVVGTAWVSSGELSAQAFYAGSAVGALATNVLVVNNVRDVEQDTKAGKRTLIVRFGRRFGELEFIACIAVAYLVPLLFVLLGFATALALLPWATLPLALKLIARVRNERGGALNLVLANTAKLVFLHGLLFALGLAMAH